MNGGRNLSAALASSPSSPLSITVHWCFSPLLLYSSSPLLPRSVWGKRAACLHTSGQDWWLVNSISQHCRPHWCRTKSINPSKVLNICAPQPGVTISFISLNFTFLRQVLFFCVLECFASSSLTFHCNYGLLFQKEMSPWNVTSYSMISIRPDERVKGFFSLIVPLCWFYYTITVTYFLVKTRFFSCPLCSDGVWEI